MEDRSVAFRTVALLLAFCAVLASAPPAAAGAYDLESWKTNDAGWAAFGKDTMVHYRTVRERHLAGVDDPVIETTESTRTLLEVKKGHLVFSTRMRVGDTWLPARTEREARVEGYTYKQTEVGPESVKIGDVEYACTKIEAQRLRDGAVDAEAVFWLNNEHGVLKSEQQAASGAGRRTQTVTKLDATRTVGGTTLACREIDLREPFAVGTVVVSDDLPGHIVEMRLEVERAGTRSTLTRTLVAFVTK